MTPPPLMEELEEEVLLRFPPHEPALLVRASLVCKRWRRIVSDPGFRRRFRELHRTPPMLGLLCNFLEDDKMACFLHSAVAFCSVDADLCSYRALDARHGRVLLCCPRRKVVVVWDPIADMLQEYAFSWTAAVLCAACGHCDHLDCHRGPFVVVCVGSNYEKTFVCTYSSDAATWSMPITSNQPVGYVNLMPSLLVGNALYFAFRIRGMLLKYDLESREISVIEVPHKLYIWRHVLLDSGLALATVYDSKLWIWRKAGPEVDAGWTRDRSIELESLLPADVKLISCIVVGFAHGIDLIFLRAGFMLFTIDLKTYKVEKVCKDKSIHSVVPYISFCTPALEAACTDEGSSVFALAATTEN
ncbi:unnamed protein product [Urochloa decumbens]|uniref:F-box domain-containing protein n=1 Tax=Urochloa decumbens TaxID=240449 RepID=A0ABC9FN24_9POAL